MGLTKCPDIAGEETGKKMLNLSTLDCFTLIQVPLMIMGRLHFVLHGIGPVETGAYYIRSDLRTIHNEFYLWRDMGYVMWTNTVNWVDPVAVVRVCRDTEALPDRAKRLARVFHKAKIKDIAVVNDVPRWVKVFQYLFGDSTNQDDDVFRQEKLSPECSSLNTDKCTSKDIIKLAHMGLVAVDGEYNCFVESMRPEDNDIPTYTFDEVVQVEDIVDKTIWTDKAVRTTLVADGTGRETAIVIILGRVHLIRRITDQHAWYLVNRVGNGGSREPLLSFELEKILRKRITGSSWSKQFPEYLISPGTQQLSGYFGCPEIDVPAVDFMFNGWWKNLQ